jgi:hypothetical protein
MARPDCHSGSIEGIDGDEDTGGVWGGSSRAVEPLPNLNSVGVRRLGEGGGGVEGRRRGGGEEEREEGGLSVAWAEGARKVNGSVTAGRLLGLVVRIVSDASSLSESSPRFGIEICGRAWFGRAVPDMFKPRP